MSNPVAYVTHESALAFYRSLVGSDADRCLPSQITSARDCACTPTQLKPLELPRTLITENCVHLLVPERNARRPSKYVKCHVASPVYPRGSFWRIDEHIVVASPELVFLQMAEILEPVKLIELGQELCGTFARDVPAKDNNERRPLTSIAKLSSFLDRTHSKRSVKRAKWALDYIVEGAASPMEIILEMLLCLPRNLGGRQLPTPLFNQKIPLDEDEQHLAGVSHYRCDLFWPDAFYALEYYGKWAHSGAEQVAYDSRRLSDIQSHRIQVDVVTFEQISTPEQTTALAEKVRRKLHVPAFRESQRQAEKRLQLHRLLLP